MEERGVVIDNTNRIFFGGDHLIAVKQNTWIEDAQVRCTQSQRTDDWNRYKKKTVCCWCKKHNVTKMGESCEFCSDMPSNPILEMQLTNNRVFYDGIPFHQYSPLESMQTMRPEVALAYAHMRVERQQKEIGALKSELCELKQCMSNFIAACELVPDGPMAQEIVERTRKMFKN